MSMLRRALTLVSSERKRLRDAVKARDVANSELEAARTVVARVQAVIDAENLADREAKRARFAAENAAMLWVATGADTATMAEHAALDAISNKAAIAAREAQKLADAARSGMPRVKEAEATARQALDASEDQIREVIGFVLLTELQPQLEILKRAAKQYQSAHAEIEAAFAVLNTQSRFVNKPHRSSEATAVIKPILDQAEKAVVTRDGFLEAREDLKPRRAYWEARAKALRADPDAE